MGSPWSLGELIAGAFEVQTRANVERAAQQPGEHGFADDLRYPRPEWVTGERGDQIVRDAREAGSLALGRSDALPLDMQAIGEKYGLLGK